MSISNKTGEYKEIPFACLMLRHCRWNCDYMNEPINLKLAWPPHHSDHTCVSMDCPAHFSCYQ